MNSSLNATFCKRDHSQEVIIQLNLLAIHKMCPQKKRKEKYFFVGWKTINVYEKRKIIIMKDTS